MSEGPRGRDNSNTRQKSSLKLLKQELYRSSAIANAIFGQGSSEKALCNKQDLTRQKARVKGVQGKVEGSGSGVLYITFYYSTHKKSLPPCK